MRLSLFLPNQALLYGNLATGHFLKLFLFLFSLSPVLLLFLFLINKVSCQVLFNSVRITDNILPREKRSKVYLGVELELRTNILMSYMPSNYTAMFYTRMRS